MSNWKKGILLYIVYNVCIYIYINWYFKDNSLGNIFKKIIEKEKNN